MRLKDNAKRSRPPTPREELPHHLSTMVHQVAAPPTCHPHAVSLWLLPSLTRGPVQARRRSVELLLQSPGMARRRGNTSRYDWKKRQMLWKVEWTFRKAGVTAVDDRCGAVTSASAAPCQHAHHQQLQHPLATPLVSRRPIPHPLSAHLPIASTSSCHAALLSSCGAQGG